MKDPAVHCSVKTASVAQQHCHTSDETPAQKIKKQIIKLWQWSLKLQEASNTSLLQPQNGEVPEEEIKAGKVKKSYGLSRSTKWGCVWTDNGKLKS